MVCRWFGFVSGIWSEALGTLALVYFYMPWLWRQSIRIVAGAGLDPQNEIYVTIVYFLVDSVKDTLLSLPWGLWHTFVIEERYSSSKCHMTNGLKYFAHGACSSNLD